MTPSFAFMCMTMLWMLHKKLIVGGVTSIGIDSTSRYLVVVSHSGRRFFKLSDGSRVARDSEAFGPWYFGAHCEGFGPLHGIKIPIFGFGHKTPAVILQELERSHIEFSLEDLRRVVISLDRQNLRVGYTDEIQIYKCSYAYFPFTKKNRRGRINSPRRCRFDWA
jgi:hypothetical protein